MSEEQRQSSKLWEPGSFDACKNAAAPMIVMLGCLELDMEVSDVGMETMESDDYRGLSKKDGDANGVLAATHEGARFSCKDGLLTHLSSQLVDCVGQDSCIQGPKSRKNQAK